MRSFDSEVRITVIFASVDKMSADSKLYEMAYENVSEIRRDKTDRRAENDRAASLGAEVILGCCINNLKENNRDYGIDIYSVDIETAINEYLLGDTPDIRYNSNGSPYCITDSDSDMFVSISHSGKYVACAAGNVRLGIDIERCTRKINDSVFKSFTEKENRWISGNSDENDKRESFIKLWTIKEAYGKMTGEGVFSIMRTKNFLSSLTEFRNERIHGLSCEIFTDNDVNTISCSIGSDCKMSLIYENLK